VIYPELQTPVSAPPPGVDFNPPPPPDLYFVSVAAAEVPPRTRSGRPWDDSGAGAPDPFAIVYINGEELFKTPTEGDSFNPTWKNAQRKNYTIPKQANFKVELWNDNPLHAQPICIQSVKNVRREAAETGDLDLYCDGGGRIFIEFRPADARWGVGFYYELRSEGPAVTRVLQYSPASRAGLRNGDQILSINGLRVAGLDEKRVRSAVNSNLKGGLKLEVRTQAGIKSVTVNEGPIYSFTQP
jgi:hypothetical protein